MQTILPACCLIKVYKYQERAMSFFHNRQETIYFRRTQRKFVWPCTRSACVASTIAFHIILDITIQEDFITHEEAVKIDAKRKRPNG